MSCNCPTRKDFSNRSPLPSYSKNTSAAHVRSWKNTSKKTSKRKKKKIKKKGSIRTMGGFLCGVLFLLAGLGGPLVLELLLYQQRFSFHSNKLLGWFHFTRYATRFFGFFFFFQEWITVSSKYGPVTCFLLCPLHTLYLFIFYFIWKGLCARDDIHNGC